MSNFFGTGLNQSPRNFELGEAAYWDLDQLKQIILVDTNVDLSDIRQSIDNTNQNVTNLDNATLKKSANLSDLTNKATARDNLGLGNISTLNYNTSYFDVSSGSLVLNQSVRNSLGLADTSVQKNQVVQGQGSSTANVMSQKAVTDGLNEKAKRDSINSIGLISGDAQKPYMKKDGTEQIIELGLKPAAAIDLGDIGTNSTGRPMLITFMSTFSSVFAMDILVNGVMVARYSNAAKTNSSGSASVIVLDGQSWRANSVEKATGWML